MTAPRLPRTNRRSVGTFYGKGYAALQAARECVALGACKRTVEYVTGLPATFILRTVFDTRGGAKRGRPPYADEFLARSTRKVQASASGFAARYELLRLDGYRPASALLAAYRHYLSIANAASMSFDEAFYLCCSLEGIWARDSRNVQLVNCRKCGRRHLQPLGAIESTASCTFCMPIRPDKPRANKAPIANRCPQGPSVFDARVAALAVRHMLAELGAHVRVIDALLSELETIPQDVRPDQPSGAVFRGMRLPLVRWNEYLTTVRRAQYSMVASSYFALRGNGFSPFDSLVAAFRQVAPKFTFDTRLSFDRAFEVVSITDARWGARERLLELSSCTSCMRGFIVSLQDKSRPQCPFCLLQRFPGQYHTAPRLEAASTQTEAGFRVEAVA